MGLMPYANNKGADQPACFVGFVLRRLIIVVTRRKFCLFEYRDHTFFHASTSAGSRRSCLNMKLQAECSNIFQGTRQMLMH